jgi:hypothetical protein
METINKLESLETLLDWAENFQGNENPFNVFLDLIGYTQANFGETMVKDPSKFCGFLELDLIADALKCYTERPHDVEEWLNVHLF